ncbi:MAG: FAD-binding oxidoreductase [Actinobacteria bacterium]|nr:MAG: FAD-binding oxidoreductase [Actinomycetota bacterium]
MRRTPRDALVAGDIGRWLRQWRETTVPIPRREFLRRAGQAAVTVGAASQLGWLQGCGRSTSTGSALRALADGMDGRVVAPGDPRYGQASQLFDPRFDDARPLAVAECLSSSDVERAVRWATAHGIRPIPRSGGHSYAGYSTGDGLVIDVTGLNRVSIDRNRKTATIGAGSRLIDVYSALSAHGVAIPAGSCPTVGVAGLTLGGGVGLSSRKLGLTSDQLMAAELVTASGQTVTCDARTRPELFWACRGGGGGNFGVATSFTFRLYPVKRVAIYQTQWSWEHAAAVFDAWQRWAPTAPDELFSICKFNNGGPRAKSPQPVVTSFGQYLGPEHELATALGPLLASAPPTSHQISTMSFLDAQRFWAGCEGSVPQCHLPNQVRGGTLDRWAYKAKSDYVAAALPPAAIDTMIRWVEAWPGGADAMGGGIQMDSYGGAINRVAPNATAFVHRDSLFSCQYLAFWLPSQVASAEGPSLQWIDSFYGAMRPYVSGFAYQNYIDPDLGDWLHAYYGSNLTGLTDVKRAYDPGDVFRFAQSIPV